MQILTETVGFSLRSPDHGIPAQGGRSNEGGQLGCRSVSSSQVPKSAVNYWVTPAWLLRDCP